MLKKSYKVSQTLQSLTLTKSYMQTKKKRREYVKGPSNDIILTLYISCTINLVNSQMRF